MASQEKLGYIAVERSGKALKTFSREYGKERDSRRSGEEG